MRNQTTEIACCGTVPSVKVSREVKLKDIYTKLPKVVMPLFGNELTMTIKKKYV
jgi:hypothetical protein